MTEKTTRAHTQHTQPGVLKTAAAKERQTATAFNGIFELLSVAENLLTNRIDNCSTEKTAAATAYDSQWYRAVEGEKTHANSMEIYQMFEIIFSASFYL